MEKRQQKKNKKKNGPHGPAVAKQTGGGGSAQHAGTTGVVKLLVHLVTIPRRATELGRVRDFNKKIKSDKTEKISAYSLWLTWLNGVIYHAVLQSRK